MKVCKETEDVNFHEFMDEHDLSFPIYVQSGCHYSKILSKSKALQITYSKPDQVSIQTRGFRANTSVLKVVKRLVKTYHEAFDDPQYPAYITSEDEFNVIKDDVIEYLNTYSIQGE